MFFPSNQPSSRIPSLKAAYIWAPAASEPNASVPTRRMVAEGCPRLSRCGTSRPMPPASNTPRRVITVSPVRTSGSPAIVRLQRELSTANERLLLAVQRPSSLNASGLIVDGRSSTLLGRPSLSAVAVQVGQSGGCSALALKPTINARLRGIARASPKPVESEDGANCSLPPWSMTASGRFGRQHRATEFGGCWASTERLSGGIPSLRATGSALT